MRRAYRLAQLQGYVVLLRLDNYQEVATLRSTKYRNRYPARQLARKLGAEYKDDPVVLARCVSVLSEAEYLREAKQYLSTAMEIATEVYEVKVAAASLFWCTYTPESRAAATLLLEELGEDNAGIPLRLAEINNMKRGWGAIRKASSANQASNRFLIKIIEEYSKISPENRPGLSYTTCHGCGGAGANLATGATCFVCSGTGEVPSSR